MTQPVYDIESLPWSTDTDLLEDRAEYLVQMKHGIMSGRWDAEDGTFGGYYWRTMEWFGHSWIKIEDPL